MASQKGKQTGGGDPTGEERPDIEAEAKARLKGSVGGAQALVQIATAVSQGVFDREAGQTAVFELFGFDQSILNKLIKEPKTNITVNNGEFE